MNEEQMKNEKLYEATMSMARRMKKNGLITEEEYCQIDTMFIEKYRPVLALYSVDKIGRKSEYAYGKEAALWQMSER